MTSLTPSSAANRWTSRYETGAMLQEPGSITIRLTARVYRGAVTDEVGAAEVRTRRLTA